VLLLFDIDGTLLLQASREHAIALFDAMDQVHHVEVPRVRIDVAGLTDPAIARAYLLRADVSAERIDARASTVRAAVCRDFAQLCPPDLSSHVAPGMLEVLETFTADAEMRLSIVTGNYEPVARLKLKRAGLGRFFPLGQGGFGNDDEDRAALPEIARRRAGTNGRPWPAERTVVIGDTPRDIACARADGSHVIAIATGSNTAQELAGADVVIEHASELPAAVARPH